MSEPYCHQCSGTWCMKWEKVGKQNLYLLHCTNPNCNGTQYAEVATHYYWRKVTVKSDAEMLHGKELSHRVGGRSTSKYGGYNTGLGEWVEDKQHHDRLMKERGLTQAA